MDSPAMRKQKLKCYPQIESSMRCGLPDLFSTPAARTAFKETVKPGWLIILLFLYLFRFLKFFSFDGTVVAKNILVQND